MDFDPAVISCGSVKYGSLAIFTVCLLIGTWGTNNYVGINVREMRLLIDMINKSEMETRKASPSKPLKALLSNLLEISPAEPQRVLLPKLQEVVMPEPQKVLVMDESETPPPNVSTVPPVESHKALLPRLQEVLLPGPEEVPLLEPQEILQHELQKGSLLESSEASPSTVPADLPPQVEEVSTPKLEEVAEQKLGEVREQKLEVMEQTLEVPEAKLEEVAQPLLQEVAEPKLAALPEVRLSKRDSQLVSSTSEDPLPATDLNCTGPCVTSLKVTDQNGGLVEMDSNDISIILQTEFENQTQDESANSANEKQDFRVVSFGNVEVENLSSGNIEYRSMPGDKLELQQEHSIKLGYDPPGNVVVNLLAPENTKNLSAIRANKSEALEEDDTAFDNMLNKTQGSFAAAAIFAIMWTASVIGFIGMATEIKELLIGPCVLFAVGSLGCLGLIFVDMGVWETSGFFAGIIYFLMLLGAVFKVIGAAIFLYFCVVVFSYYKELRDGPYEPDETSGGSPPRPTQPPEEPTESPEWPDESPSRLAQSPSRLARSPPRPAQSPPRPAQSPPRPAQSPPRPAQSPPKPDKPPPKPDKSPPRPPPPLPKSPETPQRPPRSKSAKSPPIPAQSPAKKSPPPRPPPPRPPRAPKKK